MNAATDQILSFSYLKTKHTMLTVYSMPQNDKRAHFVSSRGFEIVEHCIKVFKDNNMDINTS
jgi:maleate cis-trans isomerase